MGTWIGIFSLLFYGCLPKAWANPDDVIEYYSARPTIQAVPAVSHPDLSEKTWPLLKRAQLEFVAEILGLYPDQEIYFLARDSELIYDLSVLLMEVEDRAQLGRLHLINVSRANLVADHLLDYLAQEGISAQELQAGKRFLFVDTGFFGTIPKTITQQFVRDLGSGVNSQFQSHFLSSVNRRIPSSRVFLATLNPASLGYDPGLMRGTVLNYEFLHRFSFRSDHFEQIGGRWEPGARRGSPVDADGSVSRSEAVRYMEDLKQFSTLDSTRSLFHERLQLWRQLKEAGEKLDRESLVLALKSVLQRVDFPGEAIVRDLIEWRAALSPDLSEELSVWGILEDLDLTEIVGDAASESNLKDLSRICPHWKSILEDPWVEIPRMVHEGQFTELNQILDVIQDSSIQKIIFTALAGPFSSEKIKAEAEKSLLARIDLDKGIEHQIIAGTTFMRPSSVELRRVFGELVERGNASAWSTLARVFFYPYTQGWGREFGVLVSRVDDKILHYLKTRVIGRPHTLYWGGDVMLHLDERLKKLK